MPLFHIQWHVSHDHEEFTAIRDEELPCVPHPGMELIPFDGAAPVEVARVLMPMNGQDPELILRSYSAPRAEQFALLRTQLGGHGWHLS